MKVGVNHGMKQRHKKGEDFSVCAVEQDRALFGVFDSHGGAEAGQQCKDTLVQELLSGDEPFELRTIVDKFWSMDLSLGVQGVRSGTTATLLLVGRKASPSSQDGDTSATHSVSSALACTMAWVGDSIGVWFSMTDRAATPPLLGATSAHTPENEAEVVRCRQTWRVRHEMRTLARFDGNDQENSFRLIAAGESLYAQKRAPTRQAVVDAATSIGLALSDAELTILVRAFGREKHIEAPERRSELEGRPVLSRTPSKLGVRLTTPEGSQHGPRVVQGGAASKVTTCVTRSIGDWDASRALIPHPDVTRFVVNPGEHVRVIMASDGMWDMVTTAEALRTARRAATAQQAADRLVALAYRRSASRFNELRGVCQRRLKGASTLAGAHLTTCLLTIVGR